jgi:hypothetical protein
MMTNVEQIQWEEARRAVYGFFSQAFIRGPSQQFLAALISDEGTANLREIFRDAAYQQELAQVRLDAREGRLTLEGAVLDFEALFRVGHRLSSHESVYRAWRRRPDQPVRPGHGRERLYLKKVWGPTANSASFPTMGVELSYGVSLP